MKPVWHTDCIQTTLYAEVYIPPPLGGVYTPYGQRRRTYKKNRRRKPMPSKPLAEIEGFWRDGKPWLRVQFTPEPFEGPVEEIEVAFSDMATNLRLATLRLLETWEGRN